MWLGSGIAVAVVQAGSCSSNMTPSLGTATCCTCGHEANRQNTDELVCLRFASKSSKRGESSLDSCLKQKQEAEEEGKRRVKWMTTG